MLFSVVVCTLNRAESLERTLDSLMRQTIPAETYEVIVVDNASTDSTSALVAEWGKRFNNVHYVYEPNLGLNRARNRGWREAKGRWVAYIDDDAVAVSQWLEKWQEIFENLCLEVTCAGGKIVADWGGARPTWLPPQYESIYTVLDYGNIPRVLKGAETIFGANMVFCRALLEQYSGFDDSIGAIGDAAQSYIGDESELVTRLRKKNILYYSPDARVKHVIARQRLRRSWFLRRMYILGKSQVALDWKNGNANPYSWRRTFYDSRQALIALFKAGICFRREQEMFKWLAVASQKLGRASEEIREILKGR